MPDPRVVELLARATAAALSDYYGYPESNDLRSVARIIGGKIADSSEFVILPADTVRTGWANLDDFDGATLAPVSAKDVRVIVAPDPKAAE